MDAKDGPLDVRPGDLLVGLGTVLPDQPLVGNHALPLGQELAGARRTGQPDRGEAANEHRDEALKEEDVAPGVDAHRGHAPGGDAGQARGQQAAKGAGHGGRGDVDADAEEELLALVKGAQVKGHAGHGAALEDAEDGARDEQARVGGDEGGAEGDEAEADDEGGEVVARADALEDDVGGDFDEEVDDVEDGEGPVEAGPREVEVLGHALDAGVADVGTVEKLGSYSIGVRRLPIFEGDFGCDEVPQGTTDHRVQRAACL